MFTDTKNGFCNWSRAISGPETRMIALDVQDYATLLLKQSDDKSGKLTADRGPCSSRSGRNVSKITASARNLEVDGKSGNLEMNTVLQKRMRELDNRRG